MAIVCNTTNQETKTVDLFPSVALPAEQCLQIFSRLDGIALVHCRRVNTLWYQYASDDSLWKGLFPEVVIPTCYYRAIDYIDRCAVTSKGELEKGIKDFSRWVTENNLGKYKCLFPNNPGSYLEVHIMCSESDEGVKCGEWNETYIFMKTLGQPESEMESFQEVKPTVKIVSKCYFPGGDVSLTELVQARMNLPKGEGSENSDFFNRIIKVLNERVTELEWKVRQEVKLQTYDFEG